LDPKGLNHWQKLCATILVASDGCINALAMGHGHLCYILSSRLPPTIVFAGAHSHVSHNLELS
jgi:hypothetical protein